MTVREKIGRRRYVHFSNPSSEKIRGIVQHLDDSRIVNYYGMIAMKVRHNQIPHLKELAAESEIGIDMISGTLKALRKKVSEVK
ncbi:MAG: hypothetical protein M0Z77_10500 [Thermoplasmatales archaeon]|jgi:hypothetical protein|nr:hypothetical protein [Candidatus Thermoplasmatota archaeon]MCL6002815.1 hypothetical protein [Candidatus Thermoplasmatota archaeon]MDA8056057.1 hypothetical protein [Thermoplasmatales archaeon]